MARLAHPDVAAVARGLVVRTCGEQGLPEHLDDPATLAMIVALIAVRNPGCERDDGAPKSSATDVSTTVSARKRGRDGR